MTITDLYTEYRVAFRRPGEHHHAHGAWVQSDCPHCSPHSGSFRLGWNTRRRYYNCWACGPHRTAETLAPLLGLSLPEAVKVAQTLRAGDDSVPAVGRAARRGKLALPEGDVGPLRAAHRRYLERRGFDPRRLERVWELQGITHAARPMLAWRILIPIHDRQGKVVSWTSRSISLTRKPRYMTARPTEEEVDHRHLLYGEHLVRGHAVVVHEGPADAWATGPGAVAVLGMNPSMQQVYKIAQYPVRVVCFDGTDEAQRRAARLCAQLAPFPGETTRVRLESAEDAADCLLTAAGRQELARLRRFLTVPALSSVS